MIDAAKIEELRGLLAKATPGPWEADNEKNDGCYGVGDDCHEGFKSAAIHAPDGRGGYVKLFDALNSDAACIEEEWDEDGHSAWDEVSRVNAALIVAMRNALPDLLDLAASLASAGEDGELCKRVDDTLQAMASQAFVPMGLWDKHSNGVLALIARIRALNAENEALRRPHPHRQGEGQ